MEELLEEIPDIKDNTKERIDDEDNLEGNAKWGSRKYRRGQF